MDRIKSFFIAIGIVLAGVGIIFLVPILLAIAAVVLTAVGIICCLAIVFLLVEDEKKSTAITHEDDKDT